MFAIVFDAISGVKKLTGLCIGTCNTLPKFYKRAFYFLNHLKWFVNCSRIQLYVNLPKRKKKLRQDLYSSLYVNSTLTPLFAKQMK